MNPIKRLRDAFRTRRAQRVRQEISNRLFINPLCSDYENVFAQVRPYITEMTPVLPYGVGRNGGRLAPERTPELNVLKAPNEIMGEVDFLTTAYTIWLTEDELDIHVHKDGRGNVIGYTLLNSDSKSTDSNGEPVWYSRTTDGIEMLTREEVMQLVFSRSPKNVRQGVSPARSIRALAQTQDVLWQYQKAYIQNGAIPASITFIRASSQEKFESARAELERNLSGANNRGKTIYIWRQYDNDSGTESDQIEVKTIQGNNSTLAIKEISDIINDHLNKAYGVSNFILGDDSSAKYDNAELSRHQFLSKRVYPALLAFWNQFQFELDRVTGGLGYAISFDLELPELTERKKVKAETAEKNVRNLIDLIGAGSRPDSAVKALELGDDWTDVARGIYVKQATAVISQENKKIAKNNQAQDEPSTSSKTAKADRILPPETPTINNRTVVAEHEHDKLPEMTSNEIKIYNYLVDMARSIMEDDASLNETEVVEKINVVLEQEALAGEEKGAKALELLTDGDVQSEIRTQIREGLKVSEALRVRLSDRTTELVNNYGSETRRIFSEVLESNKGKSANEIRKALREVIPTWQAERIARNETVYAFRSGRLENDKVMASCYGLKIQLVWRCRHDGKTCPICEAMDGETTVLGEAFTNLVETEGGVLAWEQSKWNDSGQIPDAHVNCRCYFDEEII